MKDQWIALDMYFFAKPFPMRLRDRFGATGQLVFIAFLCACKQDWPQGEITFVSDSEALQKMGVEGWPLIDDEGHKWTLDEFWTFTGRFKQTKKTARGRVWNVKSTQFERWQKTIGRDMAAERQRRSRAKNGRDNNRDTPCDMAVTGGVTDKDNDKDISLTHPGVEPPDPKSTSRRNGTNPRAQGTNPRANGTNPRAQAAEARRELIPDWQPDPQPAGGIDRAAVADLRANPAGKHP